MEKKKENNKILNVKELTDVYSKLKEVLDTQLTEDMLKNNVIEFEYEKVKYRIKKPNFKQRQEAYQKQVEKRLELLMNPAYMLEDDLKKLYKEKRNIDVDEITKKIQLLEKQKDDYRLKLGKALKDKANKNETELYRKEIEKLDQQQSLHSIKKANLLEISIENQTLIHIYSYLTYLITEKKEKDKWIRAWKTYDEFLNTDDTTINKISWFASIILRNELTQI